MPRENSPYKWDKKKLIIKLDSADWEYFKNKTLLIDSAQLKMKKMVF